MFVEVASEETVRGYQDRKRSETYETISCAILTANFPTLVPPYFWTSHFAEGSIVFWCRFGGVRGGENEPSDDGLDGV